MSADIATRPARKSDAAEIALLVNIAVHGGMARGWAGDARAEGSYDPIEVGRLEMMRDDTVFGWRSATVAEVEGEVAGMLLGYREPDVAAPLPPGQLEFMVPILELEAEAAGTWFISMLGVHMRWRGTGVGSQLLEVAGREALATAARGVTLIVEDVNEGARRLYQRHGYSVRSSRPMLRYPGGGGPPGEDWLLMAKD